MTLGIWSKGKDAPKRLQGRALQTRNDRIKQRDNYTCQKCGRVTIELEVDHIIPLAISHDDSDAAVQCLCLDCHALKTAAEHRGRVSHVPEWLPVPLVPVTVVCGPPASGKSTYVAEHASKGDLVLDADEIACRMTGKPIYTHSKEEIEAAVRYRNTALGKLGRSVEHKHCWLIVTASTRRGRSFWKHYGKELVVLDPGARECIRRIETDERRPMAAKRRQIEAAKNWERGPTPEWTSRPTKGCDADGWAIAPGGHG